MILFRYLARQLLQVTAAVTLILLVVSFTSRFLQYLGDAVAGQMTCMPVDTVAAGCSA